jgi:2-iminobutanoate/2-iminopropanoate deaminase
MLPLSNQYAAATTDAQRAIFLAAGEAMWALFQGTGYQDAETGERLIGSIEEQTEQALRNLAEILRAANSGIDQVLKTTVYVSDIQLWDRVNRVYAGFFGAHRPARAVVPTRDLHFGFQIEIEAIAAVRG